MLKFDLKLYKLAIQDLLDARSMLVRINYEGRHKELYVSASFEEDYVDKTTKNKIFSSITSNITPLTNLIDTLDDLYDSLLSLSSNEFVDDINTGTGDMFSYLDMNNKEDQEFILEMVSEGTLEPDMLTPEITQFLQSYIAENESKVNENIDYYSMLTSSSYDDWYECDVYAAEHPDQLTKSQYWEIHKNYESALLRENGKLSDIEKAKTLLERKENNDNLNNIYSTLDTSQLEYVKKYGVNGIIPYDSTNIPDQTIDKINECLSNEQKLISRTDAYIEYDKNTDEYNNETKNINVIDGDYEEKYIKAREKYFLSITYSSLCCDNLDIKIIQETARLGIDILHYKSSYYERCSSNDKLNAESLYKPYELTSKEQKRVDKIDAEIAFIEELKEIEDIEDRKKAIEEFYGINENTERESLGYKLEDGDILWETVYDNLLYEKDFSYIERYVSGLESEKNAILDRSPHLGEEPTVEEYEEAEEYHGDMDEYYGLLLSANENDEKMLTADKQAADFASWYGSYMLDKCSESLSPEEKRIYDELVNQKAITNNQALNNENAETTESSQDIKTRDIIRATAKTIDSTYVNDKVDIEKLSNIPTLVTTLDDISSQLDVAIKDFQVQRKEMDKELKEAQKAAREAKKEITKSKNELIEYENSAWYEKALGTAAVCVTTVCSGVLKLFEWANDGLVWVVGMSVSGVADLLTFDDFAKDFQEDVMDHIARDQVGELNELFYEDTSVGRYLNTSSAMKYNSEEALFIRNITAEVVLITLATCATVITGGAASPALVACLTFAAGFTVGAGQSAETSFQSEDRDFWGDSIGIAIDGTVKGIETVGYAKMGASIYTGVKGLSGIGLKTALSGGAKKILSKEALKGVGGLFTKESLKVGAKSLGKASLASLKDIDTYLDAASIILGDVKTGIETGDWNGWAIAGKTLTSFGANAIFHLPGSIKRAKQEVMYDDLFNGSAYDDYLNDALERGIISADDYNSFKNVDEFNLTNDSFKMADDALDGTILVSSAVKNADEIKGLKKAGDLDIDTIIEPKVKVTEAIDNPVYINKADAFMKSTDDVLDVDLFDDNIVMTIDEELGVIDELNIASNNKLKNIFLEQKERFNLIKGKNIDNKVLNIDKNGEPYFKEGTIFHGTQFDEDTISSIAENGIITGQAYGILEDGETFYHADFYRVKSDITVSDYNKKAIDSNFDIAARTPFTNRNQSKNSVAFVIEPSKEIDDLLSFDPYRQGTTNGDIANEFINGLASDDYDELSSVLYGVPSEAISGLVVGDDIISSSSKINFLKERFPDAYIVSRSGDIIYDAKKIVENDYFKDLTISVSELKKIDSKMVDLFSAARDTGLNKSFFLGFEEHNFVHVKRVADESVSMSKRINELIDDGVLNGYAKMDEDIIYLSGLAHDLGMSDNGYYRIDPNLEKIEAKGYSIEKQSISGYKIQKVIEIDGKKQFLDLDEVEMNKLISELDLKLDSNMDIKFEYKTLKINDDVGKIIRKNHPLNSAITVMQNKEIFGEDAEMIACLSLIHSKSTSGVNNIDSYSQLSSMVETLYQNQVVDGQKIYDFDISKLVKVDSNGIPVKTLLVENNKSVSVYQFNDGVAEKFRTGAVALRVGDAHALKTGYNHGGGKFIIDKNSPTNLFEFENINDIDKICEKEASVASIYIDYGNIQKQLSGGDYDYSKRIVLGESNSYALPVTKNDDKIIYKHIIKTNNSPACTWKFGIAEKFGEYKTFRNIKQKVVVEIPSNASDELLAFYNRCATNYRKENSWLDIEILRGE